MGRPEPSVLFAQTFVHPQLDEYVDEVLFSEPIVITACEFLEQGASSTAQAVSLAGATLPPSFAVEVFVHCEGEPRFRRLCQPFLYSHSSSNVLEVEAVVTNHLVVRGSYRSLSLVIYGNTAEDLGQFNIELDDSSLTDLVGSVEGKLEDLPMGLRSTTMTIEDSISSLNVLSIPTPAFDIPFQVKNFLLMVLKILEIPDLVDVGHKVLSTVVAVATSYISHDECCKSLFGRDHVKTKLKMSSELEIVISDARKELLEVYKTVQNKSPTLSAELPSDGYPEFDCDLPDSKQLVDIFNQYFNFERNISSVGYFQFTRTENLIFGLSMALLLCSGREGCFHFVNSGGMEQLSAIFSLDTKNSTTVMLLLLGALERATRYSIGCEGFLGWWPRADENVPDSVSEGYSHLLRLLLTKPRHDIASLATCVLRRLRLYELASRYESAVLCLLGILSTGGRVTNSMVKMLTIAEVQLKKLLKLINSYGPIEDPSPVAAANNLLVIGQKDGLLSYGAASGLISSSNCCFSNWDIDYPSLALLKERGFLSLSAALLSSSTLREAEGQPLEIFLDIISHVEAVIFSFLFCRSGLVFLLQHPELSTTLFHALNGGHDVSKEDCLPLRYTSVLISKGFFCGPQEVGTMIGIHLRVVNAIDRLLTLTPDTEEFLWVLWELCGLSRSHCGCQALSALGYFPEVIKILIEALHSVKESESSVKNSGSSPVNLAIFHSASEIIEVIVTDSTASSLASWIGDAMELDRALHLSSPGSNRKDAPTRLLEWIDAGVVYHKHGGISLLRYAAVLASGGDAQLNSTSILVSDLTDVENVVGDSSSGSDVNVMENLGKLASEKSFDGVALRDSSVAQLTTAFRILAFISENPTVAAVLYDEGAIIVIYTVLVNCRYMLERASNTYDYLVDDGTECNTTSDLLLERNREQSIIDLLVPSLVLLISLLQKLQETKELHRNTKLMNALLRLHREVSPKLAACSVDLFTPYPDSALGFGAVCHLIVSALALWPVHGWSPGLFPHLLASVQSTSMIALGPKETCSLLSLLSDLFPDEGLWQWINGMPMQSVLRMVAVGTLLGPHKERQINWYLESAHLERLLLQLTPQLEKIAQIIQQYAVSALVVIQDLLRVFIVRITRQRTDNGCILIRPLLTWIIHQMSEPSHSETDGYKVFRLLDFLSSLMEHPLGKTILLREGFLQMLTKVLDKCFDVLDVDEKQLPESTNSSKSSCTLANWCLPIFKAVSLLCCTHVLPQYPSKHKMGDVENLSSKDLEVIICYILKSCQVLPVGKELVASLLAFTGSASCSEGQSALQAVSSYMNSDGADLESQRAEERGVSFKIPINAEWKKYPPLLCCAKKLLRSIESVDGLSPHMVQAVYALAVGSLQFCLDGKSLNEDRVRALKCLFGFSDEGRRFDGCPGENIDCIMELVTLLSSKFTAIDCSDIPDFQIPLNQVSDFVKSLSLLLERPTGSLEVDSIISSIGFLPPKDSSLFAKIVETIDSNDDMVDGYFCIGALGDKFLWECPETLPDRLSQSHLAAKRKMSSLDGPSRRSREGAQTEIAAQNAFPRGSTPSAGAGPTRRDTFRQRKPNTSRPPSMHVDDYVARERNGEGGPSSNVIAIPRVGSSSGRPPSIHVDEFMARERERQNSAPTVVGEATVQAKFTSVNASERDKVEKPKQLKTDLDDDLQGIDIVFDGEESDADDKLPFLQPDDNLQQPAPVIVEQSSPHSIVEETESDANENHQFPDMDTPMSSNIDENAQSEFSSRMSISRPEFPLTREPSVSSEKKYLDQLDEPKNLQAKHSSRHDSGSGSISGFPPSLYNNIVASPVQLALDSRMAPQNFYTKHSPQHIGNVPAAAGSLGLYDHRFLPNQPPLPPMPPPPTISGIVSHAMDPALSQPPFINSPADVQHQMAFQVHTDYPSSFSNSPSSVPATDSKYSRASASSPVRHTRPPPLLPPTPPPYASSPYNLPSVKIPPSQSSPYAKTSPVTPQIRQASMAPSRDGPLDNLSNSGVRHPTFSQPPLSQPMGPSIPPSLPLTVYGNTPNQQQGENLPGILQSSIQSLHSIQLPPLQAPQLPRPPQPPQQLRPAMQASQQLEQGMSMHSSVQMQLHPLHMMQQAQVSPMNSYYQMQQQEYSHGYQPRVEQSHHQGDTVSNQQESGMSLQDYFKSPEAIQSLLSDRDKLCQLLEQHPKLMQMLQEKLGQL